MRHISAQEVDAILTPELAISIVRRAMITLAAGATRQLPRGILDLAKGRFYGSMTGSLWSDDNETLKIFGSKLVSVYPAGSAQGHSSHQGLIVLFSAEDGAPLATIDAGSVTAIRTAAASAVATEALANADADSLTLLGCGEQAHAHALAIQSVRPIKRVTIWGRNPQKAASLAERLAPLMSAEINTAPDVSRAIHRSAILCCVTSAQEPYLFGRDLEPGMHINLVGSSFLGPVEVDSEVVRRSRFIVDNVDSAKAQAAEFAKALEAGVVEPSDMVGEIGQVLSGELIGREKREQITVYKSLGHIVQDLVAAMWLYQNS